MSEQRPARLQDGKPFSARTMLSDNSSPTAGFHHDPYRAQYALTTQPTPQLDTKHVPSLPSFAALDSAARDKSRFGALLNAEPRELSQIRQPINAPPINHIGGSACVCTPMKPLVRAAGQLIYRLNEVTCRRIRNEEYDEFLSPVSPSLQTMQWVVDQLTGLEAHLRHERESPIGVSHKRMAIHEPSITLRRPMTPSKRARKESTSAADMPGLPSPMQNRQTSPPDLRQPQPQTTTSTINHRLLPSPSSSSIPPFTAGVMQRSHKTSSTSSPQAASSTSAPSLHSAPMTSVASEYIADLQHQVTLKSLALQSLQAEHTNLLQRMHRETVKYQAIEKKSHVAEQEINDLLAKNDELSEQVKEFIAQVAELDRRREAESQASAREKQQWGRMLDMSDRLQRKVEQERQRLQEENAHLIEQVGFYEKDVEARFRYGCKEPLYGSDAGSPDILHHEAGKQPSLLVRLDPAVRAQQTVAAAETYRVQAQQLRKTLESVRKQNLDISEKAQELQAQRDELAAAIGLALQGHGEDEAKAGAGI